MIGSRYLAWLLRDSRAVRLRPHTHGDAMDYGLTPSAITDAEAIRIAHNDCARARASLDDLQACVTRLRRCGCTNSMLRVMDAIVARHGIMP